MGKFFKLFLNSLGVITFLKMIYRNREDFEIIFSPLIIFYSFIYFGLTLLSFVFWEFPSHIPIPFIGDIIIDRCFIIIGFVFYIIKIISD